MQASFRQCARHRIAGLAAAFIMLAAPAHAIAADAGQRLVIADGALTEIIYALGEQNRIVGIDTTSLFPPDALKQHPNIGYVRALSAEGILSLRPSSLIAGPSAGPPDVLKLIEDAGVPVLRVPDKPTAQGVIDKIERTGIILQAEEKGKALAARVQARFAALQPLAADPQKKRVLFILSLQNGRALAGGAQYICRRDDRSGGRAECRRSD